MTFKKEPRYWVRRSVGTRWAYLNATQQETIAPAAFGEDWSNGQPATYTMHQATKVRDQHNVTVDREAHYAMAQVGDSFNT